MSQEQRYSGRWLRTIGPVVIGYSFAGLLVEASVPRFLPENALTMFIGEAAKAGVFVIWFYLIWRIFSTIKAIYGSDSAGYLARTPIWRILLDVMAAYVLAAFCFSVLYVYLVRQDTNAFSAELNLGNALYFSIVSMTTTGYGDISPKSGAAKFVVCLQILFGFLYNVLFFSIFAGLAGRRRSD
ncbi:MAG TPA: potassium channel family protein [Bradyrhizobium sp.]|nr:potassium channel family protein [Bradyrhizobium sp.]